MTNDRDIPRYEFNEAGELPLSYGRYCRWEDVEELIAAYKREIERLADNVDSYGNGYDDGWAEAKELYKRDY
jgi:hypothetical protein